MCSKIINYTRDSFDRYGDDLCEVILSYLPISDCFRLQCVNKQFNHLIFNNQTKLTLTDGFSNCEYLVIDELINETDSRINLRLLDYVLKNCININELTIIGERLVINDELIDVISVNCKHLEHLNIESNGPVTFLINEWQSFADNILKNIKTLSLYRIGYSPDMQKILEYTPNLKSLNFPCLFAQIDHRRVPNIQYFSNIVSMNGLWITDKWFIVFANYFKHQLKSLGVQSPYAAVNFDLMKHLADFENLEHLNCHLCGRKDQSNTQLLQLIGLKCTKLVELTIFCEKTIFYHVIDDRFKSLEKLTVKNYDYRESIGYLKNCVSLKHLVCYEVWCYESDYKNIHLKLPQLKSIAFCGCELKNAENIVILLSHLAKLPNLCDLKIVYRHDSDDYYLTDSYISFIDNCLSIRKIGIYPELSTADRNKIQQHIRINNRKTILYSYNLRWAYKSFFWWRTN